jgi:hypothetical protein
MVAVVQALVAAVRQALDRAELLQRKGARSAMQRFGPVRPAVLAARCEVLAVGESVLELASGLVVGVVAPRGSVAERVREAELLLAEPS